MNLKSLLFLAAFVCSGARAGNQIYEPLAASVQAGLHAAIADSSPMHDGFFENRLAAARWKTDMSRRLDGRMPQYEARIRLLERVHYEATRAGLDPQLVLALIQVESNFHKYAVSNAGARGLMQVMPFWAGLIGDGSVRKLFDTDTNLRYGCVILRYYLDRENGNLYRALGRYNGSLGRPEYPNAVLGALKRSWRYEEASANAGLNLSSSDKR
jgi:soluble lytic murein transglycosylase-like protein